MTESSLENSCLYCALVVCHTYGSLEKAAAKRGRIVADVSLVRQTTSALFLWIIST